MKKDVSEIPGPEELSITSKKGRPLGKVDSPDNLTRRSFLGKAGGLATVAMAAGAIPLEPLLGGKHSVADASVVSYDSAARATASFNYRTTTATAEDINVGVQPDNGDATTFTDFSGSYSKALRHDALGVPNAASWLSMKNALTTGSFADFQNILVGTPGGGPNSKLNGPQVALALDLEGRDSHATVIPPAPSVASAQTAAEQVEHYWAALLADVPFTDYPTNSLVAQAVKDMNGLSFLKSSANNQFPFPVTPQNLFRGEVFVGDGNVQGPYISQFLVQPTSFGAQPLSQQYQTFLPVGGGGSDFMTTPSEYQLVQNGGDSGRPRAFDSTFRFVRDGRDLAAYTHVDVLYQGYFVAFLVLAGMGAPLNPGNPYIGSNTQDGFGTFGGPDFAATIGEVATRALKASWYQKWFVHRRARPEVPGAIAQLIKTGQGANTDCTLSNDLLNSHGLAASFRHYSSYLLAQA